MAPSSSSSCFISSYSSSSSDPGKLDRGFARWGRSQHTRLTGMGAENARGWTAFLPLLSWRSLSHSVKQRRWENLFFSFLERGRGVIGVDCAQEAMGSVTVCYQVLLYLPARNTISKWFSKYNKWYHLFIKALLEWNDKVKVVSQRACNMVFYTGSISCFLLASFCPLLFSNLKHR
jgi:hypothetical protein